MLPEQLETAELVLHCQVALTVPQCVPTFYPILLGSYLARYSMWFSNLVTPVSSPDWDNRQLGEDDGPSDGCCHFLGTLHTQTHVAIVISDSYKGLEKLIVKK